MLILKNIILPLTATFKETLVCLDKGGVQLVLVVDKMNILKGTITDGDIRRGLLNVGQKKLTASDIMNKNFHFGSVDNGNLQNRKIMKSKSIRHLPILKNGKVIDLIVNEDLLEEKIIENPILIMAGGEGKRLRPLTNDCPKPMLKVGNKPILEIIIEKCIKQGFRNFYISVNYLKDVIIDYFEDGSAWGINIEYLSETKPLGTGGCLSILPCDITLPIIVLNGDVLTRVNLNEILQFHLEQKAWATLCVRNYTYNIPFGVVELKKGLVMKIDEKPDIVKKVNAGMYVLDPEILNYVPPRTFIDMPDIISASLCEGKVVEAFEIHEDWLDIGQPSTLEQARKFWNN
jgi:dTDP-glucose pyrophosphorylase/predicted transcriptional regulator